MLMIHGGAKLVREMLDVIGLRFDRRMHRVMGQIDKERLVAGVIDHLDGDNSRVVVKTVSSDPAKVKTAVITIDKTSMITIDKVAATYDDLLVGDQVSARYSQGVAVTLAVTRTPAKSATPPAKP